MKMFLIQQIENPYISKLHTQTTDNGRIGPAWSYSPVKSGKELSSNPDTSVTVVARKQLMEFVVKV